MSDHDDAQKEERKRMSKKKKIGIGVGIFLVFLALLAGTVYYLGHRYYAKTNYVTDEEATRKIEEQKALQAEKEAARMTPTPEEAVDPELLEAQKNMERYASTEPITTDGDVYNVLLVGLDTTKEDYVGNSDSMILVSLNYRLRQISMISLMRDTHVKIPGVGYRKLNAAYPNGGGPLLTQTVTENYKVAVDRYVTVDFGNMIDIVDEIGTIELTFTEKEAENANKSIKQQCRIRKEKSKKYLIPGEGTYECNGMQAVAYARIRKVGNSDYQRTERQREVLMKLLDKVKAMSFEDLDKLAGRLLPMLTHNVPESEFWGLVAKAPTLLSYGIVQDRLPYDGMFNSYNGDLVPSWDSTIRKLKETIYGADVLDEEGNVVTPTPTPEGTTQTAGTSSGHQVLDPEISGSPQVVEAETGKNGSSSGLVYGEYLDNDVVESLQSEKKAAVIADQVEAEQDENETEDKKITYPYESQVFVLKVPKAPQARNQSLAKGEYTWKKPRVSSGISSK